MPHRRAQSAERLARDGGLGRGVVDAEPVQRIDDRTGTELVFDREARRSVEVALPRRDDGDARARPAPILRGDDGARDGGGVAQTSDQHERRSASATGAVLALSRHARRGCGGIHDAEAAGIRRRRRPAQHVDEHDDVGGREAGEARSAPLEAHLVPGLVERVGHRITLRQAPSRARSGVRHWSMRVLLKIVIDADADAAWRALHSPRAVAELYGPLIEMEPLDPEGLPTSWEPGGEVGVGLTLGGLVPLGRQLIHVSDRRTTERRGEARIFRDSGIPISGPLAGLDVWDHQIAVAPASDDPSKTLWRERLVIGGAIAPVVWPVLWMLWQWRAGRIAALAPSWAHDPPSVRPDEGRAEERLRGRR